MSLKASEDEIVNVFKDKNKVRLLLTAASPSDRCVQNNYCSSTETAVRIKLVDEVIHWTANIWKCKVKTGKRLCCLPHYSACK